MGSTRAATAPLTSWRSAPRRTRLLLAAIVVATAAVPLWNLGRSGDFDFYASAARSMSGSWRAFAFGAFDPAGTVTLDKLSGFLVPQALAARLFGFGWASLALPQVLEGLVTTYCCATIALRLVGARAGLVAGGAAVATPIFASMFGHSMEDGLLTAALAVALLWWQRAATTGALWPLVVSGLAVGVGFQAKMLQAWFVLPAIVLALPLAVGLRRALPRIGVLVGVAVVTSLAWMTAMQLTPGHPWFDGSVHDDVFSTVFGYNGLDRLLPPAPRLGSAATALQIDESRLRHSVLLSGAVDAQTSPVKLLLPYYTTQIGWLYPLALAGVALGAARWRRPAAAGDRAPRAVFAAVVLWLVVAAAVLSRSALAHTAYVSALGVQLAVLAAVGAAEAWRLRAAGGRRAAVLPALIVVEAAWGAILAVAGAMPLPLVVLAALLVLGGLAATLLPDPRGRVRAAAPVLAVVALLAGSACWTLQALDPTRSGTPADAYLGPKTHLAGITAATAWQPRYPNPVVGGPVPLHGPLGEAVERITGGRRGGAAPLFAVDSERLAAPIVAATGLEELTDGGYSGGVPVLTVEQLRRLQRERRLGWLLTFLHVVKPVAVDRFARSGSCHVVQRWGSDPDSRLLQHGLEVWRCP